MIVPSDSPYSMSEGCARPPVADTEAVELGVEAFIGAGTPAGSNNVKSDDVRLEIHNTKCHGFA